MKLVRQSCTKNSNNDIVVSKATTTGRNQPSKCQLWCISLLPKNSQVATTSSSKPSVSYHNHQLATVPIVTCSCRRYCGRSHVVEYGPWNTTVPSSGSVRNPFVYHTIFTGRGSACAPSALGPPSNPAPLSTERLRRSRSSLTNHIQNTHTHIYIHSGTTITLRSSV